MGCVVDPVNHEPVDAGLFDRLMNHPFQVIKISKRKGNGNGAGKFMAQVGVRFVPIDIGADTEVSHDAHARAVAKFDQVFEELPAHARLHGRNLAVVPGIPGTADAEGLYGIHAQGAVPLKMFFSRGLGIHARQGKPLGPPVEINTKGLDALRFRGSADFCARALTRGFSVLLYRRAAHCRTTQRKQRPQ
ncbi:MAG: hypothetical protein BWY09_01583 [Candidatus Hydrogenedentes bacterium ADurb.Bin179]|nr:MAG: hypothetical protein BWY09_01583 [Candidatus Hydrogenedentes bacterium ADurb.Bin179]